MKKHKDEILAKNLLERKKANSSLRHCYKKTMKLNIKSICVCVLGTAFLFMLDIGIGFPATLIGVFIGAFARDLGLFLAMKNNWPFTEKVIDWEKVEQLADTNDDVK